MDLTSDTDILVILVAMIGNHQKEQAAVSYSKIIMDCGQANSRRYIDVRAIHDKLESIQPGFSTALPGLHAFTGSDFTASFFHKGKKKALSMLQDDEDNGWIDAFNQLSQGSEANSSTFNNVESFTSALYGMWNCKDINVARRRKLYLLAGWKNGINWTLKQ